MNGNRMWVLRQAEAEARARLREELSALALLGMPHVEPRGKLIRPVVALAGLAGAAPPPGFAAALAAVQLAHEASLVHDDIVDRARERRGEPSVVARRGVSGALIHGDHLLTSAYRAATRTGSLEFATAFARAVERTVAGEIRQAEVRGTRTDAGTQRAVAEGKSGELFGCALAAAALLRGSDEAARIAECGRAFGVVYQMIDDLLDYVPGAATGKPPLADYRQRLWTWPLDVLGIDGFGADPAEIAARVTAPDHAGRTALAHATARIDAEIEAVRSSITECLGPAPILDALLERWRSSLEDARGARAAADAAWAGAPTGPAGWMDTLASGSRSFRFAARLFPAGDRQRIAGVYSFCRLTDDLVDRADGLDADAIGERLDAWHALARRAYDGESTGVDLVDAVMADAARSDVPFRYVFELIEGMRMDLRPRVYADVAELRTYTYRAAGVVGRWLTELHDVRDEAVLERAATMGHAMQLTNILRDVGEDLDAGRVYLPLDLLEAHGLDRAALARMRRAGRVDASYRNLLEELMAMADAWYAEAFAALPALPRSFQRPVAVAAHVYRGIHDGIRRNGHDNLTRRAVTTGIDKATLAVRGLIHLRRARRRGFVRPPVLHAPPAYAGVAATHGASGVAVR